MMQDAKEEGIAEGIEKGIKKGLYDNKIETAKKCLSMKFPMETIVELTGLSENEILKL